MAAGPWNGGTIGNYSFSILAVVAFEAAISPLGQRPGILSRANYFNDSGNDL
jgi:hypothetical protein